MSQFLADQRDPVVGIHHGDHLLDRFDRGGLVAGEPVHRQDLDAIAERGCLGLQPGLERLFGAALDHRQQP